MDLLAPVRRLAWMFLSGTWRKWKKSDARKLPNISAIMRREWSWGERLLRNGKKKWKRPLRWAAFLRHDPQELRSCATLLRLAFTYGRYGGASSSSPASSPLRAMIIADELAGLFLNMSRYSNGSDREFWLEAWNGKHFIVERMGRRSVAIDHLLIGITGGLQPISLSDRFKAMTTECVPVSSFRGHPSRITGL